MICQVEILVHGTTRELPAASLGLHHVLRDFGTVLEACSAFLIRERGYATSSGAVGNWRWTVEAEDQVIAFRDSIAFLNIKVGALSLCIRTLLTYLSSYP